MLLQILWLIAVLSIFSIEAVLRFSRVNEAPFMVSIRRTEYELNFGSGHHHCSGALIDSTTVVTAASCLYDSLGNPMTEPKSFTIVAGTRYLRGSSDDHGVERECDKIIPHPYYDPLDHSNDIAYMKIVIPFDTSSAEIKPIAFSESMVVRDTVCQTFGWAWLNESSTQNPPLKVQYGGSIQIASKEVCSAKYDKFEIDLQDDKVCAEVKHDEHACVNLDPGGVLICFKKLVGLVSIYSDCSLYDYPTVFTHISSHKAFLETRREVMLYSLSLAQGLKTVHLLLLFVLIFVSSGFQDQGILLP